MATAIQYDYELAACVSCGGSHSVTLMRLSNGVGHYVTCPENNEPVMVDHDESAPPRPPQAVQEIEPTFPAEPTDEEPVVFGDDEAVAEEPAVAPNQAERAAAEAAEDDGPSEEVAPV